MEEIFYQRDVDIILTKKPVKNQTDFWIWKHTRSGDYTVKSGYWCANQEKFQNLIQEVSVLPSINGLKDEIWLTQAPAKIKNFLWREISGALPVVDNIISRGVKMDNRMPNVWMRR